MPKHKKRLSEAQIQQIKDHLATLTGCNGLRNEAFFGLWSDTGLRIEDACGLKISHVVAPDGTIRAQFDVPMGKVSTVQARTGKRKTKTVTCYLSPATCPLLVRYLANTTKVATDPLFSAQGKQEWIFYNRISTSPIRPPIAYTTAVGISCDAMRKAFKGWLIAIGLDPADYSTHSVRRSFIMEMRERGVLPEEIQLAAGHDDIRATFAYFKPEQDQVASAVAGRWSR